MQRRIAATLVAFAYAAYSVAMLWHGLLRALARPRGNLGSWVICAVLALLCYGMATRQRWARAIGLIIGVASLPLWAAVMFWGYAFSGFSNRSGEPGFSLALVIPVLVPLLCSLALVVLLARPLADEAPAPGQ